MHSSRMRIGRSLPYSGVFVQGGVLPNRDPLRQRSARTETLPDREPLDRDPLDRHSLGRHPPDRNPPYRDTPQTETPRTEIPLDTEPPLNRMTHRCKNITFPQLRLRVVNIKNKLCNEFCYS